MNVNDFLYKKVGKKYIVYGKHYDTNIIPCGLWYISGGGMSNLDYYIKIDKKPIDLKLYGELFAHKSDVEKRVYDRMKHYNGYTYSDVVNESIAALYEQIKK